MTLQAEKLYDQSPFCGLSGLDKFLDPGARFDPESQLRLNHDFYQQLNYAPESFRLSSGELGFTPPTVDELSPSQQQRLELLGWAGRIILVPHLSQADRILLVDATRWAFRALKSTETLIYPHVAGEAGYLLSNPDEMTQGWYTTDRSPGFRRNNITYDERVAVDRREEPRLDYYTFERGGGEPVVLRYPVSLPDGRKVLMNQSEYLEQLLESGRAVEKNGVWSLYEVSRELDQVGNSQVASTRSFGEAHNQANLPLDALLVIELLRLADRMTRQNPIESLALNPKDPHVWGARTILRIAQEATYTLKRPFLGIKRPSKIRHILGVYWHPWLNCIHIVDLPPGGASDDRVGSLSIRAAS